MRHDPAGAAKASARLLRPLGIAFALVLALLAAAAPAQARLDAPPNRLEARIDIKSQRMVVKVNGQVRHIWHVSTAREGFVTPRGVYAPKGMHKTYFSRKYDDAPMPYSIFFKGGYAVRGTGAVKALGAPASHGCIRLATGNARTLYHMVKRLGPSNLAQARRAS